ncbi:MAG: hypothetical protein OEY01_11780 [Desulfobulbaceae bacterium]|nr:hypothetical protein [Desulfobulbaceae bacterium]
MWRQTDDGRKDGRRQGIILLLLLALAVIIFLVGPNYRNRQPARPGGVVTRPNPELKAL